MTQERRLLSKFADDPRAPFSIHKFVDHGARACGTYPGQWFGPSATARCIKYVPMTTTWPQTYSLQSVDGTRPFIGSQSVHHGRRSGCVRGCRLEPCTFNGWRFHTRLDSGWDKTRHQRRHESLLECIESGTPTTTICGNCRVRIARVVSMRLLTRNVVEVHLPPTILLAYRVSVSTTSIPTNLSLRFPSIKIRQPTPWKKSIRATQDDCVDYTSRIWIRACFSPSLFRTWRTGRTGGLQLQPRRAKQSCASQMLNHHRTDEEPNGREQWMRLKALMRMKTKTRGRWSVSHLHDVADEEEALFRR